MFLATRRVSEVPSLANASGYQSHRNQQRGVYRLNISKKMLHSVGLMAVQALGDLGEHKIFDSVFHHGTIAPENRLLEL